VTEVARKLQQAGVISYARGVIRILDRAALQSQSCDCYQTLVEQSAILATCDIPASIPHLAPPLYQA
jgi:hypothetical protein